MQLQQCKCVWEFQWQGIQGWWQSSMVLSMVAPLQETFVERYSRAVVRENSESEVNTRLHSTPFQVVSWRWGEMIYCFSFITNTIEKISGIEKRIIQLLTLQHEWVARHSGRFDELEDDRGIIHRFLLSQVALLEESIWEFYNEVLEKLTIKGKGNNTVAHVAIQASSKAFGKIWWAGDDRGREQYIHRFLLSQAALLEEGVWEFHGEVLKNGNEVD